MAEIERGTNTDEEANADTEEDSPAEDSPAESISDLVGSIVSYFELFGSVLTTLCLFI